jgi:hypothetical protein
MDRLLSCGMQYPVERMRMTMRIRSTRNVQRRVRDLEVGRSCGKAVLDEKAQHTRLP